MSMTREQAQRELTETQAQLYQLGQQEKALTEKARTLAGFLNIAQMEDKEKAQAAELDKEKEELAKLESERDELKKELKAVKEGKLPN